MSKCHTIKYEQLSTTFLQMLSCRTVLFRHARVVFYDQCRENKSNNMWHFRPPVEAIDSISFILTIEAAKMSMAVDSYFETLKLEEGVSSIAVVQDRAVCSPKSIFEKKEQRRQSLKETVRTAATKFSIDECDEPLYCPKRQLSSTNDFSSSERSSEIWASMIRSDTSGGRRHEPLREDCS